jgi:serine/threonine protein kinase
MSLEKIGRYELLAEIASGGMATVYAARATGAQGFEKLVALKRMLPEISSDIECRKMFIDEGRLAAHIRSSYVVSTFDLQQHDDGSLYLVMDLVIGASLASILRGSGGAPLPIPALTQLVQHAARGLHDAHEACSNTGEPLRIVHRDVSPQNILVGLDGSTRITDFGIAHAENRLAKTAARELKGKMAYFSPEQAQGEPVDGRSDLFSLGIVFWESLTQRRLFKGADVRETLSAVLSAPIPDPRSLRPDISPELAAVVMRTLERDPARRYQNGLQLAEALKSAAAPAGAKEMQAPVQDFAGASVRRLVTAIQDAIRGAETGASAGPAATDPEHPAIRRVTLGTMAMAKFDIGDVHAEETGPLRAPDEDVPVWLSEAPTPAEV